MERSFRVVAGFLLAASLFSCNFSKIEDFKLGKDFVSSTAGVVLIDTMRILASTVHLDSIATTKPARMLIGGNQNSITGNVTCTPYFQFHSTSLSGTPATDLVYDSVVVKYNYDGYYIGDTTRMISFSVKPITPKQGFNSDGSKYNISPLKLNADGQLYNTSSFKLSDEILGVAHLVPRPKTSKNFYFRLSDTFGHNLYDKIMADNDTIRSLGKFQVFFPGVAFVSEVNQNQTAVGISHSSLSLRVYYHAKTNPAPVYNPVFFDFPVDATGVWFNQILYSSQGSLLGSISLDNSSLLASSELPSSSTYSQTVVQGGSGVYTKIRIPGTQYLKGYAKNAVLISANIQLTPQINSYSLTNPLPDTLAVYIVDRRNNITGQYASALGSNIFAIKVIPTEFDKAPYYSLDATTFFSNELSSAAITGNSMMLGTLGAKAGQTLNYFSFFPNALGGNLFKMNVFAYVDKSN